MATSQQSCFRQKQYVSCIKIRGKPILPPRLDEESRMEMQSYKAQALLIEANLKEKRRQKLHDKINFVLQKCIPAETFSSIQSLDLKAWSTPTKPKSTNQGYNFETHLLTSPNFVWAQRTGSAPFLSQIQPFKYKIVDTPSLRNPAPIQTQSLPSTPLKPDLKPLEPNLTTNAVTNLTQTLTELKIKDNVASPQTPPPESRLSQISCSVASASTDLNPYMVQDLTVTSDSVTESPTLYAGLETRSATPPTVISQDTPTPPESPHLSNPEPSPQSSVVSSANEALPEENGGTFKRLRKLSYTLDTPSPVLLKSLEKFKQTGDDKGSEEAPAVVETVTTPGDKEVEIVSSKDLITQGNQLIEELFARQQALMEQLLAQQAAEQARLQELFKAQEGQLLNQLQSEDPALYRSVSQSSMGSTPGAKVKRNLAAKFDTHDAQQWDTAVGPSRNGDVLDIHRQRASLTSSKGALNAPSPLLRGLTSPFTQNQNLALPVESQSQLTNSKPPSRLMAPVKDWKADKDFRRKCEIVSAHVKGYLTRRLMRTERVKRIVQTIEDTLDCLVDLQRETQQNPIRPEDESLRHRLLQQLNGACYALHDVFFTLSAAERMHIIAADRELQFRRRESQERTRITPDYYHSSPETASHTARSGRSRSLSLATQKTLERKQNRQLSHSSRPNSGTSATVSSRNSPKRRRLATASDAPRSRSSVTSHVQNVPTHKQPIPAKRDERNTRTISPTKSLRIGSRAKTAPWR